MEDTTWYLRVEWRSFFHLGPPEPVRSIFLPRANARVAVHCPGAAILIDNTAVSSLRCYRTADQMQVMKFADETQDFEKKLRL